MNQDGRDAAGEPAPSPALLDVPMLADRMLGKLARLLRMVGHDVEYVREGEPLEIARRAAEEGRVFLTRDKKLALRRDVGRALFVENNYPFHQARQVLRALGLGIDRGFRRCVEDNGLLGTATPEEIAARVPPYVQESVKDFYRCERCQRIYWDGTHVAAMRETIAALEHGPLVPGDAADHDEGDPPMLEPLVDLHQAMEVILLQHRLALMEADLGRAQRLLRRFAMCMRRHVGDEEELVMPLYAQASPAGGYERGSAPEIFANEHRRILELLEDLERATEALARDAGDPASEAAPPDDDLKARCLRLLDREKVFSDLLEHHDLRERTYLYPALERMLTEAEKEDLLERMVGLVPKETTT